MTTIPRLGKRRPLPAARRLGVALGVLLGAQASALAAAAPAPPPAPVPGVRATLGTGFRRVEVVPEGRLLGAVAAAEPDGRRRIVLLVKEAASDERALLELDLAAPAVRVLAGKLASGIDRLDALDLDGDGRQEILLGEPHRLYVLREAGVRPLEAPGWFDLAAPDATRLRAPAPARRRLITADAGRLRCYEPAADGAALARVCDLPLPLTAEREPRGLFLETPPVATIPPPAADASAAPTLAIGPQTLDQRRLRTLVLTPGAAEPAETWARLPGVESVQQSRYALFAGQPVLAVATVRGDKLSLFEDQKLRLFRLAADRTQAGRAPFFVADTESPRWHTLGISFGDIDGDGDDDLVVVEPKGMDGKPLLLKAYVGDAAGRLAPGGGVAKLDVEGAAWSFGPDATGDGRADLVTVSSAGVRVFAGRDPARGGPVAERPSVEIPLTVAERGAVEVQVSGRGVRARAERYGWMKPLVADLDGDGRGEILLLALDRDGPGVLEVIGWRR